MWLWELSLRRRLKNRPAIRFAQDINCINDRSAICFISCKEVRKTASREEAGPASVPQGCRGTRHRFAACGLDRLPLPRQALAKRPWLTMSEPLLSRPGNQHRCRQVFAAAGAQRGIERFREQASCRMLAACLILAAGRPDDPDPGFHRTTSWITMPRRPAAWADRPSTTCQIGPSRMIGPNAFRSRTPRWTCSRHGSAICSMNCSGLAGDRKKEHPP
jgi:hypothetical protein